jgi:ribose 1,5-bisphosphokinase PhnN
VNHLIYLSGPPAVGKSTLMAELTRHCRRTEGSAPFAHDLLKVNGATVGVELGRRRGAFSGTDALSMSVNPRACAWISRRPARLILAEGDRLANATFLTVAAESGYAVTLINLTADPDTLAARAATRGSDQNPAWARGRATKADRLAAAAVVAGWTVIHINGAARAPDELAASLRAQIPALQPLDPGGAP